MERVVTASRGPAAAPSSSLPLRRRWPLVVAVLLGLAVLLALLLRTLDALPTGVPLSVVIDGQQVVDGLRLAELPPEHKLGLAALVLGTILLACLLVPVALLVIGAVVALLVVAVVALPLLAVALLLALLLSPIWLVLWLVWRALAGPSNTMA